MSFITRQKGSRRFDFPAEFPVMDSNGVLILEDRRQTPDRRQLIQDINDLKTNGTRCPGPPNLSVHRPDSNILNRWPLLYP